MPEPRRELAREVTIERLLAALDEIHGAHGYCRDLSPAAARKVQAAARAVGSALFELGRTDASI